MQDSCFLYVSRSFLTYNTVTRTSTDTNQQDQSVIDRLILAHTLNMRRVVAGRLPSETRNREREREGDGGGGDGERNCIPLALQFMATIS